jgi:hypothetical protein
MNCVYCEGNENLKEIHGNDVHTVLKLFGVKLLSSMPSKKHICDSHFEKESIVKSSKILKIKSKSSRYEDIIILKDTSSTEKEKELTANMLDIAPGTDIVPISSPKLNSPNVDLSQIQTQALNENIQIAETAKVKFFFFLFPITEKS